MYSQFMMHGQKTIKLKKRGDACQHLALATFTPETVAELEFGEILNCYELNWLLENFYCSE